MSDHYYDEQFGELHFIVTPLSQIEPDNPRWYWQDRIPLGAVTVVFGQPGVGKSTLTFDLAANASIGCLDGDLLGEPSPALIISLEDHPATVIRPRAQAADGDLDMVSLVSIEEGAVITIPDHLRVIEEAVVKYEARLLVIDPVVATLTEALDAHRDHHVRRALAPLALLAERCDVAVVVVMHFTKRKTADLLSRLGGSVGFGGAARSAIAVLREPDDVAEDRDERVIVHAKTNWARKAESLAAKVEPATFEHKGQTIKTSRMRILGPSSVTSEDYAGDRTERDDADDATEFLLDVLADGEWHETQKVIADAARQGIARRTLYRAAGKLAKAKRLERERSGWPAVGHWRLVAEPDGDAAAAGAATGAA